MQIAVLSPDQMTGPVVDFPSSKEAKTALLAFGIDSNTVKSKLALLAEIGSKELLQFPEQELNDNALRTHGFRIGISN